MVIVYSRSKSLGMSLLSVQQSSQLTFVDIFILHVQYIQKQGTGTELRCI